MFFLPPAFIVLAVLLAFVLGACIGSFVNCAALRRQTGESVLVGRSHCPHCAHTLSAAELVPIFSWLVQKGTCKHCGHALGARYVVVELIGGLCFAALVANDANSLMGISLLTIQNLVLVSILLYVSLVDLDSRIIPDGCIVAAIVLRVVYIVLAGPVLGTIDTLAVVRFSVIGALAITIPLIVVVAIADRAFKQDSMGGGDLKLFFLAGLYFGWQQGLFLIIAACLFGIVGALFTMPRTSQDKGGFQALRKRAIPFGPAIALACFTTMMFGTKFVLWYGGFL